eukprot:261610-Prymnesium_polylepis.2
MTHRARVAALAPCARDCVCRVVRRARAGRSWWHGTPDVTLVKARSLIAQPRQRQRYNPYNVTL